MLFNSLKFLFFFPVVFLSYWVLPHRFRKYFLLAASYYFYMCWKAEFIVLVLLSTAVDYFCGLGMARFPKKKKVFLIVSLTINLGLLFFFKYFNFFGSTLTALCHTVSIPFSAPILDIILPVGISFYTFQTLSYTIDIYRGKLKVERDFVTFALFVSYFPQLVAGPIERAENLLPQLKTPRMFCYDQAAHGARLMAWGFFKKCVCAAYLSQLADTVYGDIATVSGGAAALATFAFALQIYCDFGGYSDIARGCSEMLGVELMVNFKSPYFFSHSISEYWKRNHISLTNFFHEYVYIPLGGNRKGFQRKLLNLWIVFFLSGLWHGASWTFVIWGLLQALYISAEQIWGRVRRSADNRNYSSCYQILMVLKTFLLSCISLIFFRADTVQHAFLVLRSTVVGLAHPKSYLSDAYGLLMSNGHWVAIFIVLSVVILFCVDLLDEKTDAMEFVGLLRPMVKYPLYVIFLVSMVLLIPKTTPAPFIYFQF